MVQNRNALYQARTYEELRRELCRQTTAMIFYPIIIYIINENTSETMFAYLYLLLPKISLINAFLAQPHPCDWSPVHYIPLRKAPAAELLCPGSARAFTMNAAGSHLQLDDR